ncbi:hypothetical protein LPJ66_009625 [Kickxella alabastrina]|uniref:Uncharacterized protein n=1 Tax=Kickxella alabastrina TaxID=61397 RepID=A0ACC1I6I2_9FUNG|nr:hypothetical protein LPJ66_009625 [Kickxella alabastrina]
MSVTGTYLRDIHLALLLQRCRPASMLHALLDIVCYFSESSVLHIAVNRQRLGSGWQGKVVFTSSISKKKVELESPAEPCESGGSVFCYRLPSLRDEWTADFSLVFSPQYTVPQYITLPISAHLDILHIDIIDSLLPCTPACVRPAESQVTAIKMPCVCEIWIKLAPAPSLAPAPTANTDEMDKLAGKLVLSLLFENTPPQQQAQKRMAAVMVGDAAAEFCVPRVANAAGLNEPAELHDVVSVMCINEQDHLALRICSDECSAHSAVVLAAIKRLALLLGLDLDDNMSVSSGNLSGIVDECELELRSSSDTNNNTEIAAHAYFAVAECEWPQLLRLIDG